MNQRQCLLKSSSSLYPSLQVGVEKIYIGRNPQCQIKSLHCSKKQLSAKMSPMMDDQKPPVVLLNVLGVNPSFLNNKRMNNDVVYEAQCGDTLRVTEDLDFFYTVEFSDKNSTVEPSIDDEPLTSTNKRKNDLSLDLDFQQPETPPPKRPKANEEQPTDRSKEESKEPMDVTEEPNQAVQVKRQPSTFATWEDIDSGKLYIFTSKGVTAAPKIAAYDVDGTIITTQSGRVFPKDCDDWKLAFPEVPGKIKDLVKQNYKIVFFTNQAGVSNGKVKINDLKRKIENIVAKLNVPVQVFISTGKGKYRKPVTGSWSYLTQKKNDGVEIDLQNSFYCGDAAGRPEIKAIKRKKDHSSADRLFALNIGIKFFTPEEHFQGKPADEWVKPEFDPKSLKELPLTVPHSILIANDEQEVVVMVGSPASGKSHFAKTHFESHGYVYINRDTLGTWQKCVTALESAVKNGKSAVIDNTNPDRESRKRYIDACKKHNVTVRCFLMMTSDKQSRHNNVFREIIDPTHSVISDMVFNGYKSKFQEPTLKEGFNQIVRVNFVPKFDDPEHEVLYKSYLLEK